MTFGGLTCGSLHIYLIPLPAVLEREGRFFEKSAQVVKPAGRVWALWWVLEPEFLLTSSPDLGLRVEASARCSPADAQPRHRLNAAVISTNLGAAATFMNTCQGRQLPFEDHLIS